MKQELEKPITGLTMSPHGPIESPKIRKPKAKCIKVYYDHLALIDVKERARKAGYESLGLYLRWIEARHAEVLAIRQTHIIRLRQELKEHGLRGEDLLEK